MNRTFRALLFTGVIILWVYELAGNSMFSKDNRLPDYTGEWEFEKASLSPDIEFQQPVDPVSPDIIGAWEFEKAEYMERPAPDQPYRLKNVVEKEEGLYAFEPYFNNMVKRAIFEEEVAVVYGLFDRLSGRYSIEPTDKKNQWEMTVGNAEETGMQSVDSVHIFNAPGLLYLIEIIDDSTIGVTLEQMFQEDNVMKFGALRCILRKW